MFKKIRNSRFVYCAYSYLKSLKSRSYYQDVRAVAEDPLELRITNCGPNNPNDIVYIIKFDNDRTGFFALLRWILVGLAYADRFSFIPYAQFPDNSLYTEKEGEYGEKNAFEYYFEPVSQLTKEEAFSSQNTVFMLPKHLGIFSYGYREQLELLDQYAAIYRKYIRLNPTIEARINQSVTDLLGNKKTIGVHVRGTDFLQQYKNHPVCIQPEDYVVALKELFQNNRFEQIFLATDDQNIVTLFKQEFGEKVVCFNDVLRSTDNSAIHTGNHDRALDKFNLGYEVLKDMICLSRCDGLLAGLSNVSLFAQIAKKAEGNDYDFCHIFDNGINSTGKKYRSRPKKSRTN